jgi:hypothetical protein
MPAAVVVGPIVVVKHGFCFSCVAFKAVISILLGMVVQ